jgi:hypothetical protein
MAKCNNCNHSSKAHLEDGGCVQLYCMCMANRVTIEKVESLD